MSGEERRSVQPSTLLRQLDELWADFSQTSQEAADGAVVRACSLTWITVVEGDHQTVQDCDEMLAGVMRVHPSRAIIVLLREGDDRSMKGSVSAQCWRPFGSKQQVCIERILLETTRAGACDLPAVVRALLVADLPVVLFCRNANLLHLDGIAETSGMADRVVVDIAFQDTVCAKLWPALPGLGRYVSDLAWDRVIRFRRAIASHFQAAAHRKMLDEVQQVAVRTRAGCPTPEAAYLLSWTLGALGFHRDGALWRRGERTLQAGFLAQEDSTHPIDAITFRSPAFTLRFAAGAANGSHPGRMVVPVGETPGDTALLSDEMVVEYRRRTFEQFLPATVQLFQEPQYLADE
ncbi:MAG: glucose-6-phosphate dehydrogenase assembly protein OpcA [Bryobacterales bacterium]|jgi:hypothetical protein|nr:glucose-6-phosphate dehydrogenase assembly protein OpcA [Bryobacterales bacterium]